MSQFCDLVSAPTEVSFLVFQKAVQPGGLTGSLGAEHAGRSVAGATRQPGGDLPVIWGLLGLGPLETKRHRVQKMVVEVVGLWQAVEATPVWGKSTLCLCL